MVKGRDRTRSLMYDNPRNNSQDKTWFNIASKTTVIKESGIEFHRICWFNYLQSIYRRSSLFFFLWNSTGCATGEMDLLINPLAKLSLRYYRISSSSSLDVGYIGTLKKVTSSFNSIAQSYGLYLGKLLANFSLNPSIQAE